MADYYSILDKTISRLPDNTAANRTLVYSKAREAIERQLRGLVPSPGEDAIARQMLSLENAISKIEVEQSFDADMDSVAQAVTASVSDVDETDASGGIAASTPPPATMEDAAQAVSEEQTIASDALKKRSSPMRFIPYVLGIAVVGGGAYGLWLNKDALMQGASSVIETAAPVSNDGTVPNEQPTANNDSTSSEKESTRLGGNGENVAPDPVLVEPVSQPDGENTNPLVLQPDAVPPVEPLPPIDEPVEVKEVGNTADNSAPVTPVETGAPAIAQKAYLYEEGGASGAASRSDAAIVWTLVREAPSQGLPEEAVVKGSLDIPDKPLSMTITIKRNTDEGLPASHIIELNFEGGEIDNVARFVMKASEQARGEGLVAVPAKIDTGYFLIALNNLPQAVETNSKLLLDSDWIDIPLGYATGRRALVTLEKGAVGEKVFREAFDDWKSR